MSAAKVAVACLIAALTVACEAGEGAGALGRAGRAAGAVRAGSAPEVARAGAPRGAVEFRGAEPLEGITRNFARTGEYRGYTMHRGKGSTSYNADGSLRGTTRASGESMSRAYNEQGNFEGTLRYEGNVTKSYDNAGRYTGYSRADGNTLYHYDAHGMYLGYSTVKK